MQPLRRPESRAGLVGAILGGAFGACLLGAPAAWVGGEVLWEQGNRTVTILGDKKSIIGMQMGFMCGAAFTGTTGAILGYFMGKKVGERHQRSDD